MSAAPELSPMVWLASGDRLVMHPVSTTSVKPNNANPANLRADVECTLMTVPLCFSPPPLIPETAGG
jgi:hypothetical protein